MNILWISFAGRFSDNPRAIYEEFVARGMQAHHTWRVAPGYEGEFPPGTVGVERDSEEERAAFSQADLIVANTPTGALWKAKKPGARYLQTWHGTPLKKIYFDEPAEAQVGRDIEVMEEGARSWDYLITSNAFSSRVLPAACRYPNAVWETGYPRNDLLSSPDTAAQRARIRASLGIDKDKRCVLYTPTWRDDVVGSDGKHSVDLALDMDAFVKRFGDDHILLLRLHYKIAAKHGAFDHPSVRNMSDHPDIRELYLASDVMITDYSSTMFDYAITAKPMIFFTYDLSHYRDSLRGFYFDFEAEAPGPLVETSEALLDALAQLDHAMDAYKQRYQAFQEKFCHPEDGHAAARVVDRLTSELGLFL